MPRFLIPHAVIACLLIPAASSAGKDKMTFRNNTLPGHLSIHSIVRRTKRIAPRRDHKETIEYVQAGRWVQVNLDEPKPGEATVYQMFHDSPPEILSMYRGAERIRALPRPSEFNIEAGATYLNSERRSSRDNPFNPPRGDTVQEVLMRIMLDVAHWGRKSVESGHRWERDIESGYFKGVQRFEFAGVERTDIGKVGSVRMVVEGDFTGPLANSHRFGKSRAVIYWSSMEKTFARVEALLDYVRRRPAGDETYEMRIDMDLKRAQTLTDPQSEDLRNQLNVFAEALKRSNRKDYSGARAACRQFRDTWPGSIWRPAVDELEIQASSSSPGKKLKKSEVLAAITQCVSSWESAMKNQEYDLLDKTSETLIQLNTDVRRKILRLTRDDDSKARAAAAFALAFSIAPGDFQTVQKATRDASPRVRGMALTGIAARGDPNTSAEMLLLRLTDGHKMVRARACRAVGACITREHLSIEAFANQLGELMAKDESSSVRREAIRAIAAIGAPTDIAKLEAAKKVEVIARNREEIDIAIKRLRELQ